MRFCNSGDPTRHEGFKACPGDVSYTSGGRLPDEHGPGPAKLRLDLRCIMAIGREKGMKTDGSASAKTYKM